MASAVSLVCFLFASFCRNSSSRNFLRKEACNFGYSGSGDGEDRDANPPSGKKLVRPPFSPIKRVMVMHMSSQL
jgi:hypothetical protein